ncbi:MAG: hypothetical protein J6333_08160 [Planctomycetes bacterium]|nr:hypothetical protein [Planctomycetota bacterium]
MSPCPGGAAPAALPEGIGRHVYRCAPETCGEGVCCARFDVAVSAAERERIAALLPRLVKFCPWLAEDGDVFQATPCFLFIRKREGKCVFNFPANGRDGAAGYLCAIHALALQDGLNPYAVKPRGCALWPFLEDGAGNLRVDDENQGLPCLRPRAAGEGEAPDPELLALWRQLPPR